MNQPQYSLLQISQWGASESEVKLPNVQRGFVWKPSQVENLWDSLLRGYPVGSFVLSKGKTESECRELLDGQQRATAICLGFAREAFRQSQHKARIFLDLEPPKTGNRKYLFRVITRSQPWGYQAIDNTKTLESAKIYEARELYGLKDHLKAETLERFFPYDAVFPIPLELFLRARNSSELTTLVENWELWDQVNERWQGKVAQLQKKPDGASLSLVSKNDLDLRMASIYRDVEKILDPEQGVKIPALYLDLGAALESAASAEVPQQQELEDNADEEDRESDAEVERKADEIETIFIRLNAGGTPLRGEELNYSILKAHIGGDLQKRIESACSGLMSAARFITFAYRLYPSADGSGTRDGYTMKIKPRQFQKTIREKKEIERFTLFLEGILTDRSYEGETLLDYVKKMLLYHETENAIGLPYPTVSRLAGSAPEVMFLLLYRVKAGDWFSDGKLRRAMLGVVTLFAWFGKGEKLKDHAKLLSKIWPAAQALDAERFWSCATVQRAKLEGTLLPVPTIEELAKVKKCVIRRTSDIWPSFEREAGTTSFVRKAFTNRDLLLYAQRDALALWFQEEMFELDDTNVPFDWDHIFPHTFVKNKKKIPQILKSSYNTNGNFRAWPYALNRSDQDALPQVKLNPERSDAQFDTLLRTCRSYLEESGKSLKREKLPETLQQWSACGPAWAGKIKDVKTDFKKVYNLITDRNVELCGSWYDQLGIEDLLPPEPKEPFFEKLLNKTKWRSMPKQFPKWLSDDGELKCLVCGPHQVGKGSVYLYLAYPECSDREDFLQLLEKEAISFGILELAPGRVLNKVSIDQQKHRNYVLYEGLLWGDFTLIHYAEDAHRELLSTFHGWLKQCPEKKLRVMEAIFLESLNKGALLVKK